MYGSGLGVTMGAHRLWSHRSFKAKTPLKIFLLWLHTLAGQVSLFIKHIFYRFIVQYETIQAILLVRKLVFIHIANNKICFFYSIELSVCVGS